MDGEVATLPEHRDASLHRRDNGVGTPTLED